MAGLDEQGNPVCQPLDSVKDVLDWDARNLIGLHKHPLDLIKDDTHSHRQFNIGCDEKKRPKVLVCHDMKGGYLEDRFLQGCDNSEAYRFYHWHLIDTFVYFSHRFITIPPAGWIRAAHKNGVQILGTLITEWEEGSKICQDLLRTKETIDLVATKLADIAFICGFDGWLINIENVIEEKSIPDLQYFVQRVTYHCHNRLKDTATVLWYDSVTRAGTLDWQNELNDKNKLFFSVCDGIFLNYAITEEKLKNSRQATQASHRCFDVYVGVDVFGRATSGGGGFNCSQVLELISKYGLSIAIFAQGWVYENHGAKLFDDNEMKFWRLIKDFLPRRIHSVPLQTSFCQGFGQRHFLHGKVVSGKPWHNLSLQQLQPCHGDGPGSSLTTLEAYNGGGCLKLDSSTTPETSVIRLFNLSVDKRGGEQPLTVKATWKGCGDDTSSSCGLSLVLLACDNPRSGATPGKAMILAQERYADLAQHVETWDQFGKMRAGEEMCSKQKPAVQFTNATTFEEGESGWISSCWEVDTDWLFQDQNATPQCVAVFALLVSSPNTAIPSTRQPATSQKDKTCQINKSALLGNLQIRWQQSHKATMMQQSRVVDKMTCLEVNTCGPITKQKLSIVHKEFCDLKKAAGDISNEATSDASVLNLNVPPASSTGLSDAGVSPPDLSNQQCLFKNCRATDTEVLEGNEEQPVSLHILNWVANSDAQIDYYMVFSVDGNDSEQFIGCTSHNSFVVFNEMKESGNIVGYYIKPVLNNGTLLGQKFRFSILQSSI